MRDGAPAAPDQLAQVAGTLRGFGSKTVSECDGPAGLVRITAEPFTPEDVFDRGILRCEGGQRLAFHGMLHHRSDLARSMEVEPRRTRAWADSQLFAKAWERWGEEAAVHAEGEFAAVVWDPGRQTLTALCSPLDSPPLYFSVAGGRVVVASTPRGVHAGSGLPRRIDDAHLASALILDYRDPRFTYFEGVHHLCCGELLTAGVASHRVRRYWDLADHVRPVRLRRTDDYVAEGREILRSAVAQATRAVETPAVLLSSGLDSTAVAANALEAVAKRPGASPLLSVTVRPAKGWDRRSEAGRTGDEAPLVRTFARMHPALDARFFHAQDLPFDYLWRPQMELAELPPRNFVNGFWVHECRRRVRSAGRRVVLNGRTGNATTSYAGNERFAALLLRGRWAALRSEIATLPPRHRWRLGFLARHAVLPFLPKPLYSSVARWRGWPGWREYSAVNPRFAQEMRVDARARRHAFDQYWQRPRSRLAGQLEMLSQGQREGRSTYLALGALHDLDQRDPLRNRRLVLWCLGLPDELYYRDGVGRRLVRLLMKGRVPDEILNAPTRGRQVPDWHFRVTRELPRIRNEIEEWRTDPAVAERLDLNRLLRLFNTWPNRTPLGPRDHPDWIVANLGLPRAIAAGRFIRFVEHGS